MKKKYLLLLFVVLLVGCAQAEAQPSLQQQSEESQPPVESYEPAPTDTNNNPDINMPDAEPLPTTIVVDAVFGNSQAEVVLKEVVIREKTSLEKERTKGVNYQDYIAIIKYTSSSHGAKEIMSSATNYQRVFSITIGDSSPISGTQIISNIQLDESEYMTEEESEGIYQGTLIFDVTKAATESEFTLLRFVPHNGTDSDIRYFSFSSFR